MTPSNEPSHAIGSWAELVSPNYLFATITVSLGIVLFAFTAFLVSTALPSAVVDLRGAELLAWSTSLYLVLSIVSGVSTAMVMHRIGPRRLFLLSGLVFVAGTLLTGFAPSMPVLLAGRVLQGIAAGFIEAECYILIPRLFPSRLISKVFGVEAIAWAVAAFGGPVLAGYLAEAVSWRAAFLSVLPLAVLFLVLVPIVVGHDSGGQQKAAVPWLKLAGIAGGMLIITLASVAGQPAIMCAMLGAAALLFFVSAAADRWSAPRLFPPGAFSVASVTGLGLWTALVMPIAQGAEAVFLVYAMQFLWGFSALEAGLVTAVMALSWSSSQFLLSTFAGPRTRLHMIWVGAVLLVIGQIGVVSSLMTESLTVMIAAQVAIGLAFGLNWSPLCQMVMEAAPLAERDATSALLPTVMSAGYGIGAAVFGVVGNSLAYADAKGDALQTIMVKIFLVACAISVISALTGIAMAALAGKQGTGRIAL